MKLGIMQPYFFPYLGYFDLIRYTNRWIIFDTPQYIRHGWINRNRILHPTKGWQYIIAPLKRHIRETPISAIEVVEGNAWKERILDQLAHYKRYAPYFHETIELIRECLNTSERYISKINGRCLNIVCQHLGITFAEEYFSEMKLDTSPVEHAGDWALRITEALGYETYVNPIGGKTIFDPKKYDAAGIELVLRPFTNMEYACPGYTYESGLSIIDVLMWNEREQIMHFLDLGKP